MTTISRRSLAWAGIGAVLIGFGALAYYAARNVAFTAQAQAEISVTPFTVEQTTVLYPKGEITDRRTVARRRDGSMARMGAMAMAGGPMVRRLDLMTGRTGMFVDSILSRVTGFIKAEELAYRKAMLTHPPARCAGPGESNVGEDRIKDIATWKTVMASDVRRLTEWRAERFQCFPLRAVIEMRSPGGEWSVKSVTDTVLLQEGDPSPLLFDEAFQYKEMRPSELRRVVFAGLGLTEADCPECFSREAEAKADQVYIQSQSR